MSERRFLSIRREHVLDLNVPFRVIAIYPLLPREFRPIDLAKHALMSENTARKICQRLAKLQIVSKKPKSKAYVKLYEKVSEWFREVALKAILDAERRGARYVELEGGLHGLGGEVEARQSEEGG